MGARADRTGGGRATHGPAPPYAPVYEEAAQEGSPGSGGWSGGRPRVRTSADCVQIVLASPCDRIVCIQYIIISSNARPCLAGRPAAREARHRLRRLCPHRVWRCVFPLRRGLSPGARGRLVSIGCARAAGHRGREGGWSASGAQGRLVSIGCARAAGQHRVREGGWSQGARGRLVSIGCARAAGQHRVREGGWSHPALPSPHFVDPLRAAVRRYCGGAPARRAAFWLGRRPRACTDGLRP